MPEAVKGKLNCGNTSHISVQNILSCCLLTFMLLFVDIYIVVC